MLCAAVVRRDYLASVLTLSRRRNLEHQGSDFRDEHQLVPMIEPGRLVLLEAFHYRQSPIGRGGSSCGFSTGTFAAFLL